MHEEIVPRDHEGVPMINHYAPELNEVKRLIDWDELTSQQQYLTYLLIVEKKSRRQLQLTWQSTFGKTISFDALRTFALRTSYSYKWNQSDHGGNLEYLCTPDMKALEAEISERVQMGQALDTVSILDEAQKLKNNRREKAVKFLSLIRSDSLSREQEMREIDKPTRSWINNIIQQIDAKLTFPIIIDNKRFLACTFDVVRFFYHEFAQLLRDTPDYLFFTADETMMQTNRGNKVIIPASAQRYVTPAPPEMPHITAMCTCNLVGVKPPLLIIIKSKKKVPAEVKELIETSKAWILSTHSGWMERTAFYLWSVLFGIWFYNYRNSLPHEFHSKKGLLVVDGHTSRENPAAIEFLESCGLSVLVLPSHTTHVLQFFDIGLAAPLKQKFSMIFARNMKNETMFIEGNLNASLRKIAIESFVEAWDIVCSRDNCKATARAVGYRPFDVAQPLSNQYVRELTPQERANVEARERRRANMLNISSSNITDHEKLEEIRAALNRTQGNTELCKPLSDFNPAEPDAYYQYYFKWAKENGTILFSTPPKLGNFDFNHLMDTFD